MPPPLIIQDSKFNGSGGLWNMMESFNGGGPGIATSPKTDAGFSVGKVPSDLPT